MLLMVEIHWWRKQQRGGVRETLNTHQIFKMTECPFYLLAVLPVLRLQRHHSARHKATQSRHSSRACSHSNDIGIQQNPAHFLPSNEVTWKQKRRSSQSTAITEQLSRSVTSPPATSPRPWCMRLPPCVKKYWRSHDDDTRLVLLRDKQTNA